MRATASSYAASRSPVSVWTWETTLIRRLQVIEDEERVGEHEDGVRQIEHVVGGHRHARLEVADALVAEVADRAAEEARQVHPRCAHGLIRREEALQRFQRIGEAEDLLVAPLMHRGQHTVIEPHDEVRIRADERVARQPLAPLDTLQEKRIRPLRDLQVRRHRRFQIRHDLPIDRHEIPLPRQRAHLIQRRGTSKCCVDVRIAAIRLPLCPLPVMSLPLLLLRAVPRANKNALVPERDEGAQYASVVPPQLDCPAILGSTPLVSTGTLPALLPAACSFRYPAPW